MRPPYNSNLHFAARVAAGAMPAACVTVAADEAGAMMIVARSTAEPRAFEAVGFKVDLAAWRLALALAMDHEDGTHAAAAAVIQRFHAACAAANASPVMHPSQAEIARAHVDAADAAAARRNAADVVKNLANAAAHLGRAPYDHPYCAAADNSSDRARAHFYATMEPHR